MVELLKQFSGKILKITFTKHEARKDDKWVSIAQNIKKSDKGVFIEVPKLFQQFSQ